MDSFQKCFLLSRKRAVSLVSVFLLHQRQNRPFLHIYTQYAQNQDTPAVWHSFLRILAVFLWICGTCHIFTSVAQTPVRQESRTKPLSLSTSGLKLRMNVSQWYQFTICSPSVKASAPVWHKLHNYTPNQPNSERGKNAAHSQPFLGFLR